MSSPAAVKAWPGQTGPATRDQLIRTTCHYCVLQGVLQDVSHVVLQGVLQGMTPPFVATLGQSHPVDMQVKGRGCRE
jgi:hypothetical protein